MSEFQHHHILSMIEAAQRAGRSEPEIVRLVEEQVDDDDGRRCRGSGSDRPLPQRLRSYLSG